MLDRRLLLFSAAAFALPASLARAHHGWGSYDAANPVTITGAIKMLQFQNPHAHVHIEQAGKMWECVLAPPFRMNARGALEELLKVGTPCTAFGYPSRNTPTEMRAEWIEIGGKKFELR